MKAKGQARTAVIISLILHAIAFVALMGVRLYYEELNAKGEISVTFVDPKEAKPPRRSSITRPNIMLYRSPQNLSQEQAVVRVSHMSSAVFYTEAPEKTFSMVSGEEIKNIKGKIVMQPLAINLPQHTVDPVGTAVIKDIAMPEAQLQTSFISGRNFLSEEMTTYVTKPNLSNILRRFAQTVRRKIESKKRYPLAARKSMIEGRVGVKMTILNNGQLEKVEIVESSGHAILDTAALESVRRCSPFPSLPKEAERKRIQMSIYLVFDLISS